MRHEQTSTTEKSFKETIMTQEINSTDIEMASEGELYANPEILHYKESELNLIFSNNILMGKLYNLIKDFIDKYGPFDVIHFNFCSYSYNILHFI